MENPIDSIVDLGLVNYVKHPTNPSYIVFRFPDKERADSFQAELEKKGTWFERGEEERKTRTYHLIGIHKNDFKFAEKLNYLNEAKHKKPLIPFKPLRYSLVLFTLFVITLSIVGFCKQQKTLALHENAATLVNSKPNK